MPRSSLPAHVLILTDLPATVALLTKALEPEGYTVTSFLAETPFVENGPATADGARDTRLILDLETIAAMVPLPDAIVLDLGTPETQSAGYRFVTQARHDPVLGQIPLILGMMAPDGTAAGATPEPWPSGRLRVLSTPIDEDALLEVLAQVLAS
jgi:CheY-like chemotaxis protein